MWCGQLSTELFLGWKHKSHTFLSNWISFSPEENQEPEIPSTLIRKSLFSAFPLPDLPFSLTLSEREVCAALISKECLQFGGRLCKLQLVIHKVLKKQGPMCGKHRAAHFQQLEKHLPCLDVKPHLYQHEMLVKVTSTIVETENQAKPPPKKKSKTP